MRYTRANEAIILEIDEQFHNLTLLDFFSYYKVGKKHLHNLRMSKQVFLNDKLVAQNFNLLLTKGDKLQFPFFTPEEPDFLPQKMELDIVYEDDFCLAINKPAPLLVHPSNKAGLNTLVNGVSFYYQSTKQNWRIRYIHRLDVETSGLIILAKQQFVHSYYDNLLQEKQINRSYLAIVQGNLPKSGTIETFIARDRHQSGKRRVAKSGELARTHYQVLKKHGKYSLVECTLDTGRTHQIRVHLSHLNAPILGDKLYNPTKTNLINRHALHAYKVKLFQPFTEKILEIEIPLPNDLLQVIS